jgi:predicted ATP-binding protein involved in virulence
VISGFCFRKKFVYLNMYNCRIKSLEVAHIGAFEKLQIEFKEKIEPNKAEIHIFTGKNGTGKTTLLEMLVEPLNQYFNNLNTKVHFKDIKETKLSVNYTIEEIQNAQIVMQHIENAMANFVINSNKIDFHFNPHSLIYKEFILKKDSLNSFVSFDFAFFAYSGYRRINHVKLGAIQELTENPFDGCLDFNNSLNPQLLLQWLANTITKKALAFSKNDLEAVTKYADTIHRIENAVSEITGQKIEFDLLDNPLSVGITVDGLKLNFNLLPDGMKSIVSWIADLLMRMDRIPWSSNINVFDRNFILFLDEIEVHLHPEWQRKILPVVQKLFTNAQIFISTHSPFVVGSVDGAWIYKFKKEGQYSVLDGEPILSEDGKSFQYILEETFDIKEQFGVEVEKKLKDFYLLKSKILKNELDINDISLTSLVQDLSTQSIEIENIIGMEIKQLERLTNKKLVVS